MKNLISILIFIPVLLFSQQKTINIDSLKLKDVQDIFGDDYGNIYLYKSRDFSFIKYDSLGNQLGKLMLTFPYKIQSVINPLNIILFSENTQELKFVDQNLNDIQRVKFSNNFGFVKCAYAEDLQFVWLLDDSNKTLVQYNFRSNSIISSMPFNIDSQSIVDFLVYDNKVYILRKNKFEVYSTKANLLYYAEFIDAKKLRRENADILIFEKQSAKKFDGKTITNIFINSDSKIVDKNLNGFLALIKDKLYIYSSKLKD